MLHYCRKNLFHEFDRIFFPYFNVLPCEIKSMPLLSASLAAWSSFSVWAGFATFSPVLDEPSLVTAASITSSLTSFLASSFTSCFSDLSPLLSLAATCKMREDGSFHAVRPQSNVSLKFRLTPRGGQCTKVLKCPFWDVVIEFFFQRVYSISCCALTTLFKKDL